MYFFVSFVFFPCLMNTSETCWHWHLYFCFKLSFIVSGVIELYFQRALEPACAGSQEQLRTAQCNRVLGWCVGKSLKSTTIGVLGLQKWTNATYLASFLFSFLSPCMYGYFVYIYIYIYCILNIESLFTLA